MFASRMLLRVPGQTLYLNPQIRAFSLTRIALEPAKKVVPPAPPPPPPPPASKRTTKAAPPPPPPPEPEPEKPAPRKRLVLSDKERKNRDKDKERKRAALLKEREKAKKLKEKEKAKVKGQKEKEKEKLELREKIGKPYPLPPKRPVTAYILFYVQHRTEHPGGNASQLATIVSEQWKALPDAEKESYLKQAQAQKVQYDTDVAAWVASLNAAQLLAARHNKEPGTQNVAALSQLPKRPPNSYALFFKDFIVRPDIIEKINAVVQEPADESSRTIAQVKTGMKGRLAAAEWNSLGERDKQVYVSKHEELRQAYNAKFGTLIAQQKAATLAAMK